MVRAVSQGLIIVDIIGIFPRNRYHGHFHEHLGHWDYDSFRD